MKNDACSQRNRGCGCDQGRGSRESNSLSSFNDEERQKNSQTTRQQGKGLGHTKYVYEPMTLGTNHT